MFYICSNNLTIILNASFDQNKKNLILKIDEFFDNIDPELLVFREAMKAC
jgi:hypothetical protein